MLLTRLPDSPTAPHRQVDIRLCPTESLPYMLLGNSGDDTLMKILRWRVISKGWTLNEYGMGQRTEDIVSPVVLCAGRD
jgi:DNA polymerase beta